MHSKSSSRYINEIRTTSKPPKQTKLFHNLDGNNEKKDSADTSNIPLESREIKNGDVSKDECKERFAPITQQTGGYTSYLKSHKMCIFYFVKET